MTFKQIKIKERRLTYLCSLSYIMKWTNDAVFSIDRELNSIQETYPGYPNHLIIVPLYISLEFKQRFEILSLFKELGYSDIDAYSFWLTKYRNKWANRRIMNQRPIPVKKDNPTLYDGEVWRGMGTPRQPKKVRKTAWKRFNKLYPNYIKK